MTEVLEGNDYLREIGLYDGPADPHAFTCHVQSILARVMFANSLPTEPPRPGVDSDALMTDKRMYQTAVLGSIRFNNDYYSPYVNSRFCSPPVGSIAHNIVHALRTSPTFVIINDTSTHRRNKRSAWTGIAFKDDDDEAYCWC